MDVLKFSVGTLPKPLAVIRDSKCLSISHGLDQIAVLSKGNEAVVIPVSPSVQFVGDCLWKGSKSCSSLLFSENSNEFAVLTKDFDLQIFTIRQGRKFTEVAKKNLRQSRFIIPSKPNTDSVNLKFLKFRHQQVVISCSSGLVLSLDWNDKGVWTKKFAITTARSFIDIKLCDDTIYVLAEQGSLDIYDAISGQIRHSNIKLSAYLNEATGKVAERFFVKLAASSKTLAVTDLSHQIFVIDLQDLINKINVQSRNDTPVHALSASADAPGASRFEFKGSESFPLKAQHQSFGDRKSLNLSSSLHSSSIDESPELPLEYTQITALEGCLVEDLTFCPLGLTVWYSQLNEGGIYRVYNTQTGACMDEESLPDHTKALLCGYMNCVDVILSPNEIKLYTCNISKKDLADKIIKQVGMSGILGVFQGAGWQDLSVATPILTEGTLNKNLDVIKFSFKIQIGGLSKKLPNVVSTNSLIDLINNFDQTFQILVGSVEDNISSLDYAELLATLSLNHFYDLLSLIYKHIDANPVQTEDFAETEMKLTKCIVNLRSYLYHPPKFAKKLEEDPAVPKELQGMSREMKDLWKSWLDLSDKDIVQQAVEKNCIPMSHTYFVTVKRMLHNNVKPHFEALAHDWILELLRTGELSQARRVFTSLGEVPLEAMKKIYLSTLEEKLQDFLFGYLANQNMLTEDEIHSGLFLRQTKQILQKNSLTSNLLEKDCFRLTVGYVASQPVMWRDTVWAELAFSLIATDLLMQVEPPAAWNYLLIINRPDVIKLWADFNLGGLNDTSALRSALNCQENFAFADKLAYMFKIWTITQDMIEMTHSADSLKMTKDNVLDHLSRFGIFCDADKSNLSSILIRFARTRNLSNIRTVLESNTSVFSWSKCSAMLLKYCTQHKLAPVMFAFLADSDELEDLVSNCDVTKEQKNWLMGWFSLVKLSKDPTSTNILEAIEANLYLLAEGDVEAYLLEQPFITLTIILLGSEGNFADVLKNSDNLKAPLNSTLVESVKRSFPVLDIISTEESWKASQKPDITLYELLERGSAFDVTKLFGWQESHKTAADDSLSKMPAFSKGSPYEKYAFNQVINYEYYLKQGRPSYAYCSFIVDEFKYFKKISKKRIKQACNIAHGIALNNFSNHSIVAACISFIEMLGVKSEKARLHVTAGFLILKNIPNATTKEAICEILNSLLTNKEEAAPKLLALLEQSLIPNDLNQMSTFLPIHNWAVAVRFSKVHTLPMPESLLKFYCKSDMWLHFVLCLELYQYSPEQAFHLVEFLESKTMREHLKNSFITTAQCPSKRQQSPLKSRDTRKSLYSKIGLKETVIKCSPSDSSPENSSLLGISWSSESSNPIDMMSSTYVSPAAENDLFRCILACHSSLKPPEAMLEACLAHNNPFLAVLASCYEGCSSIDCLGTWIVTSLSKNTREAVESEIGGSLHTWNENNIPSLWLAALRSNHVGTLAMALDVFLPENPLRTLARFIKNCTVDKNFDEAVEMIQTFKSQCQNLQVTVTSDDSGAFLMHRTWIYRTAVQMVCTALAHNFTSSFFQHRFLQALCKSAFSEYLTVEAPDFTHLLQLQECLLETGVQLDYSALCVSRRGSEKELQACMQRLVDGCFFNQALELARIAGLSRDTVVIAQWSKALEETKITEAENLVFWKDCQVAFVEAKIQPAVAAEFFHSHAESRNSPVERYQVLQLAYSWFCLAKHMSQRKRQDCCITKAVEVEMEMWRTRLKIGKSCDIDAPLVPKLFTQTRKELFSEAGIGYIDFESKLNNEQEVKTLDDVIGELLDQGRVASALRLEALFCHKNKDLRLLVTCLSLAESEIMPYQLSSEQRLLMEQSYTPSSSFRKRPLYSLKLSSLASTSFSQGQNSNNLSADYIEVPPREHQEALAAIEKLSDRLVHGKVIGERIAACFRVSMNIDKSYVDIICVDDPLNLMKTAISKDCINKFAVASDLSLAGQISKEDMAFYLRDEIYAAVTKHQVNGGVFWGYDLDSSFHLVLELCQDHILLGKHLLDLTKVMNETANDANKKVHAVIVELLIRSHDCYTAACDMEGIAEVLLRARSITANLLQQQEWQLMVRLVTGIGRYNDMIYIFKILKDHEQFEYLLGKGMDKVPGLKIALLDFVRSKCADNRELLQLVALHFRLYSEVAEFWESEAKGTIGRLLSVTILELGIAISATKYNPKPKQPTPTVLKASADLGHHLKLAMQNFSHAAEYFLQANKLTRAMQAASQAELVALQISLTIGVPNGQTIDCLFEQDQTQVTNLITTRLSYPQAAIVAKAYSHPVDWGAALYQHCVIQNEQKYLTEFMQASTVTPVLVEDVSRRFQHESSINSDMAKMMKQIVNSVKSVEVKYRVASQLGFKDILESMISGSDLAYLKDTVWRRGTKYN